MATRVVTVDRRTWFAPVGDAGTPDPGTVVGDFVVEDERTASLRAEGLTITFTPFRPCV